MAKYLRIKCMRGALSSQKRVNLQSNLIVFVIFSLFQLIYPQVNTLDKIISQNLLGVLDLSVLFEPF